MSSPSIVSRVCRVVVTLVLGACSSPAVPHTARVLQASGDVAVEHAGVRAPAAVDDVLAADDVVHVADGASVVLVTSNGWVVKLDDACDKQVGTLPLFAKDATTESVASQLAHLGAADTRAVLPEELQAGERIAGVQQHDSAATTVAAWQRRRLRRRGVEAPFVATPTASSSWRGGPVVRRHHLRAALRLSLAAERPLPCARPRRRFR
jgi:hypothetical protein